jgi:hypothetical protein
MILRIIPISLILMQAFFLMLVHRRLRALRLSELHPAPEPERYTPISRPIARGVNTHCKGCAATLSPLCELSELTVLIEPVVIKHAQSIRARCIEKESDVSTSPRQSRFFDKDYSSKQ